MLQTSINRICTRELITLYQNGFTQITRNMASVHGTFHQSKTTNFQTST